MNRASSFIWNISLSVYYLRNANCLKLLRIPNACTIHAKSQCDSNVLKAWDMWRKCDACLLKGSGRVEVFLGVVVRFCWSNYSNAASVSASCDADFSVLSINPGNMHWICIYVVIFECNFVIFNAMHSQQLQILRNTTKNTGNSWSHFHWEWLIWL